MKQDMTSDLSGSSMRELLRAALPPSFAAGALVLLAAGPSPAQAPAYTVNQSGSLVHVKSPYGTSIFLGDPGFDKLKAYKFEIPLKDLRPPGTQSGAAGFGAGGAPAPGGLGLAPDDIQDDSLIVVEANRLYNEGKFGDSLRFTEELLRRNPAHVRGWLMKGSLLHVMGHKDLARQAWEKAQQIDPANEQVNNILRSQK